MQNPLEVRLALKAADFSIVALKGKRPLEDAWQTKLEISDGEIRRLPGGNTGIHARYTPALDIDILNHAAAELAEELVRYWLKEKGKDGTVLVRTGLAPKRLIPFRTETPFPKMLIGFEAPPEEGRRQIELLADGQQFVVHGIHPDTKQPYLWEEHALWDLNHEDLPELNEDEAHELMEFVAAALEEDLGFKRIGSSTANGNGAGHAGGMDADAAFEALRPGHIHFSQLSATASLLRQGMSLDEVVEQVLEETKAQAAEPNWNLDHEERKIRRMCFDFVVDNPELSNTLPDNMRAPFETMVAQGIKPNFRFLRGTGWTLNGAYVPPPKDAPHRASAPPPKKQRSRLIPWGDIRVTDEPEMFIDGLLPREGLGVAYGPPKVHKTFWVMDMVMHVALGRPYRGRSIQHAPVVYCAFEGQHGFAKRVEAYKRHHLQGHDEPVPFYVQPVRLNFSKEVDDLIATIADATIEPGIVVLDTLNRSLVGSESKDVDMTAYLAAADRVREQFGCLVIIVHHSGLEGGRPRGHTSLTGAADVQIAVTRSGDVSTLLVEYMKDGQEGAELHGALVVVDVGQGKTSCVIVEAEAPEPTRAPTKKGRVEDTLLDLLRQAETGLTADMWRKRARLRFGEDLSRNDFWKAKEALLSSGRITQGDNGVFRVSEG